jgi:hypothetical protein
MEQLTLILEVVNLVGLVGLGWLVRNLKGTVDAQKATIDSLRGVVDVADIPKMLDRVKAYKQMADEELEAFKRKVERESEERQRKLSQSDIEALSAIAALRTNLSALAARLIPYVPPAERTSLIDGVAFQDSEMKNVFHRLAASAPDFSFSGPPQHLVHALGKGKVTRLSDLRLSDIFSAPPKLPDPPDFLKK